MNGMSLRFVREVGGCQKIVRRGFFLRGAKIGFSSLSTKKKAYKMSLYIFMFFFCNTSSVISSPPLTRPLELYKQK